MSSTLASHSAQFKFQLDAIATALAEIVNQNQPSISSNRAQYQLIVNRSQHAISLCIESDQLHCSSKSLEFTPLFPGSHTQTDVAVRGVHFETNGPTNKVRALDNAFQDRYTIKSRLDISPLDPALHFARFKPLRGCLDRLFKAENRIVILETDSTYPVWLLDKPLHDGLNRLKGNGGESCELIVVSLNTFKKDGLRLRKSRHRTLQLLRKDPNYAATTIHQLEFEDVDANVFMTLLSNANLTIVPNVGLAIDALNAGCPYSLFDTEQSATESIELQRKILAASQINSLNSESLIVTTDELSAITMQWLERYDKTDSSSHALENGTNDAAPIIPVNIKQTDGIRAELSIARAKLRKLRQSPRQFLKDSRHSSLRRLARLTS